MFGSYPQEIVEQAQAAHLSAEAAMRAQEEWEAREHIGPIHRPHRAHYRPTLDDIEEPHLAQAILYTCQECSHHTSVVVSLGEAQITLSCMECEALEVEDGYV